MRKSGLHFTLIILIVLSGCREKIQHGTSHVERAKVTGVRAEIIRPSQVSEYYDTSGTVKASSVSAVSSRIMGTVTSIRVKEGDRVKRGHLLLTIDDSDVVQKLQGAQQAYLEAQKALGAADENRNLANITYQRYKKLYEEKALTGQEFDQMKTQMRVAEMDYERTKAAAGRAEAGMNEAKVYHGFAHVVSPVEGIITEKKIELGSMAVPGVPLMTVEDNSSYRIEINISEKFAGRIKPGDEVEIFIDTLNKSVKGTVTEAVPSVDPASRSFLAKISLKNEGLRNGLYGKVSVPVGKKEALLVPAAALVERGELTGVYVVDERSVITYRLVRPGRVYGGLVEILTGLSPAERVIVEGIDKAVDGGIVVTSSEK